MQGKQTPRTYQEWSQWQAEKQRQKKWQEGKNLEEWRR